MPVDMAITITMTAIAQKITQGMILDLKIVYSCMTQVDDIL